MPGFPDFPDSTNTLIGALLKECPDFLTFYFSPFFYFFTSLLFYF